MRKALRILALTLITALLCTALTSCGSPAKDPKDAVTALKENGYAVTVDTEKLVVAGKDGEHVTINYCDDKEAADDLYKNLVAEKNKAEEKLDEAEKELKDAQKKLDDMEDGFDKAAQQAVVDGLQRVVDEAKKLVDVEIGKSGTLVWVGTKAAIKAAK